MTRMNLENVVRNIDRRLERVEQILPTLPTREELDRKFAALVTRDELDQRLAALPTRDEMHAAIRDVVAPLTVRMEGFDRRLTEESERSRRYTQILFESLRDDIRLVAEGVAALHTTMEEAVRCWAITNRGSQPWRTAAARQTEAGPAAALDGDSAAHPSLRSNAARAVCTWSRSEKPS